MNSLELHVKLEQFIKTKFPERFNREAFNLENEIHNMISSRMESNGVCFFNDEECSDNRKPIGSHLLQRNGVLSKIAINKHVIMFRKNFSDPYKTKFEPVNIKSAGKSPVFCCHHDTSVFAPIENSKQNCSMEEFIFLITLRSFADEYIKRHEDIKRMKVLYNNIDSKEFGDFCKLTGGLTEEFKSNIDSNINELEDMLEQYNRLRLKFLTSYKNHAYDCITHKQFQSNKIGIAFSTTMMIPISVEQEFFFCVNIFPNESGSKIIFSYFRSDEQLIQQDSSFMDLLNGVLHPNLNRIIMIAKENLFYNIQTFLDEDVHCINALIYDNEFNYDYVVPKYFESII
ncbi:MULTISPECIES: hypothetical protein [unclassified Paenibacillus]|uniref:hypothetical protein n=1 Tax=unclassified Paenibacillus TaxID=185978 RepID=UPI0036347472